MTTFGSELIIKNEWQAFTFNGPAEFSIFDEYLLRSNEEVFLRIVKVYI